jgi:hypothetical protein
MMASQASASTQLLVNGSFETGSFIGWTAETQSGSSGSIVVTADTAAPNSGMATVAPSDGTYHALTGQSGAGAYALMQGFTVDAAMTGLTLSFDMFAASNQSMVDGGLNASCCAQTQNARVDILTSGASAFDTGSGIVASILAPFIDGPPVQPYQFYNFDLTSVLAPGSYVLRFAQADNMGTLTMGVDNVSLLQSTTAPVPIPASGLLLLGALGAAGALRRRARR